MTEEQLPEPALHRRTFTELSDEERQQFLDDLRTKRETLEKRVRAARSQTEQFAQGSSLRRTLDKQYAKVDKLWQKAETAIANLEHLLQEIFSV